MRTPKKPETDWDSLAAAERWIEEKYFEYEQKRLDSAIARISTALTVNSAVGAIFIGIIYRETRLSVRLIPDNAKLGLYCLFGAGVCCLIVALLLGTSALRGQTVIDLPLGSDFTDIQNANIEGGWVYDKKQVDLALAEMLRDVSKNHRSLSDVRLSVLKKSLKWTVVGTICLSIFLVLTYIIDTGTMLMPENQTQGQQTVDRKAPPVQVTGTGRPILPPQAGLKGRETQKPIDQPSK